MGSQAAVVERESRNARRVVPGARAVARGYAVAAEPGDDVSGRRVHEHLPKLAGARRSVPVVVQLRMGRGADAEPDYAPAILAYRKLLAAGSAIRQRPVVPAAEC